MGRSYFNELSELPTTYRLAVQADSSAMTPLVDAIQDRPTVFIGTGGTLALATLAASEHSRRTGRLSAAMTPQQAASDLAGADCAVVLFSARSRHPDIRIAAESLRSVAGPVVLATQRDSTQVPAPLANSVDSIVTLGAGPTDGFLATNSLLAMAVMWLRGIGYDFPQELPSLSRDDEHFVSLTDHVVILFGHDQRMAAVDMEARLSESGVAAAQIADPRNFAHGRHFGYGRHADNSTLLTISGPNSTDLIDRTLPNLSTPAQRLQIRTDLPYPVGAIDALVAGMNLFGRFAAADKMDPGRPHVEDSGRRLYRMTWESPHASTSGLPPEPVLRKMRSARSQPWDRDVSDLYQESLIRWIRRVTQTEVAGLVLDYDGTCCTTDDRREPPPTFLQEQLLSLIEAGVSIGFATGRGKSILEALRRWIPRPYWRQTHVAMYTGGAIANLDADFLVASEPHPQLHALRERLDLRLTGLGCEITERPTQLTIDPLARSRLSTVAALVRAVVDQHFSQSVRVTVSGHSVDINLAGVSKLDIAAAMGVPLPNIFAVGDRGDLEGNDFEMLARAGIGLSVDAVSPDPDSCWNLAPAGCHGPDALALYLAALQDVDGALRFRWPPPHQTAVEAV